jgi:vancomycin permeability regulator SanA
MPDGEDPMYDHPFFIQGIVWAATKLFEKNHMTQVYQSELEAAVKAAVAAEREACAKVCDDLVLHQYSASGCAAAIRARGEKK